jgi:urease accessory protein
MIIIQGVLGNSSEQHWIDQLRGAEIDWLVLDQWEAQKSRLRKATELDVEVALALDRNTHLHDGDILAWDDSKRRAIVARIHLKEVMVIDLAEVAGEQNEILMRTVFELGHALGNQHWPAIVKGTRVFVPLTVDRKVMASVMKTHALPGIRYDFVPGAGVIPYMAPHEARRLFGGASADAHSHVSSHEYDHHDGNGQRHRHDN